MGLPPQKRFTLKNVADRWGTSVPHVEEMVRNRKFNPIIIEMQVLGGPPITRHVYFDQDLYLQYYPEPQVVLTEKKEERLIAQIRSSDAKQPKRCSVRCSRKQEKRL